MELFMCTKCKSTKTVDEFPHARGVRHSWCRECHKTAKIEYRKKYREKNPRKTRIASDYLTDDGKVICSKCRVAHPLEHYSNGGGGWCKSCRAESETKRRRKLGISERKSSVIENGMKLCLHCNTMKAFVEFSKVERGLGGLSTYCKPCVSDRYYDNDKARIATAKYREVNRERHLAAHRVRMFEYRTKRKVTSDGSVTDDLLKALYGESTCYYCGENIPRESRTIDHKIPLSKGGGHVSNNLVMACWTCNCSKRDMSEIDFLKKETLSVI